ncbi:hypothetical protein B0H66DRAFT_126958 [Apodospora peruviana]|uniref:MARVEL domain-containing protein n=1 Tax=Apodospora peruviana TaxID=516989 RepID=A0AAE0II40_9PEZI|nr:hypothetical protein B0H66DRAFT_126958 [Apodospora peruviana]
MGARSGMALRGLQFFARSIEFCCAALILAIFSYFLTTLASHKLHIATWLRAVEGISGAAVLYTLLALMLLCCVAGHPVSSFMMIFLDICFLATFIYIAAATRGGASSCNGVVHTVFGTGDANTNVADNGEGGIITALPNLRQACQMETACLAVAIVGIFFFLLSALLEFALVRHRRKEKRYGPSPVNDYTSGYGKKPRGGIFGFGRKRHTGMTDDPNRLPEHPHPDLVRDSYGTEQTRIGTSHGPHDMHPDALPPTHNQPAMSDIGGRYGNHTYKMDQASPSYGHIQHDEYANTGTTGTGTAPAPPGGGLTHPSAAPVQFPAGNYRYDDGVYDRI